MWKKICDWCWFYVWIRGNEFNPKLNLNCKRIVSGKITLDEDIIRVVRDRQRAHNLDMRYNG